MSNNSRKLSNALIFIIAVALGGIIGFISSYFDLFRGIFEIPLYFSLPILAVTFFISLYLSIIIHELGHLIFGLMSGYKFCSFRIGSLMLMKTEEGLKFKSFSVPGTAGQCLLEPPDLKGGRIPHVFYNLGGVILNAVFAVGALLLMLLIGADSVFFTVFAIFFLMNAISALMNGIPMRMQAVDNDGYNTLAVGSDREAMRAFWIQLKITAETSRGVRIKRMPAEWFEIPEKSDNSFISSISVFAANRLLDEGRFDEAEDLIYELMHEEYNVPGLYKSLMTTDLIYLKAVLGAPKEECDELLTKEQTSFMSSMKKSLEVARTDYTYMLLYNRDTVSAEAIRERFEKLCESHPYEAEIYAERELIRVAFEKYKETKIS